MPLRLPPEILDRTKTAAPLATQLADHLRRLITTREIEPGAELSSEYKMAADLGISREPVRRATALLQAEGLIAKRRGGPARVVDRPEPLQLDIDKYSVLPNLWQWPNLDVDDREWYEPASAADQHFLGLPFGSRVWRTLTVVRLADEVVLFRRAARPWGLTVDSSADTGATVTVSARMPDRAERGQLGMPGVWPVWSVFRDVRAGKRVVEVSRLVASTLRVELVYQTSL